MVLQSMRSDEVGKRSREEGNLWWGQEGREERVGKQGRAEKPGDPVRGTLEPLHLVCIASCHAGFPLRDRKNSLYAFSMSKSIFRPSAKARR